MQHDNEPTLNDFVDVIRRGFWLALIMASVGAGVTYFVSSRLPPTFEARATLVVSSQDPNQRGFGTTVVTAPALDVTTYRSAITSRPVLADAFRALTALNADAAPNGVVDSLGRSVSVRLEAANISSLLRIHARDENAERARNLANAVAGAAVRWDEQRATRALEAVLDSLSLQIISIDRELAAAGDDTPIEGLVRTRGDLQLQLSSARAMRTAAAGRLELLEPAEVPLTPIAPRPVRSAGLAGVLAVFFAYGLLLLRGALDTRIRSVEDLARLTDVPVMAEFPRI
ncbi:MAG: hypothetical protein H0X64_12230, partial [Gemmatimonadaceae bacterium]|nr:hypothetical protein [Gemmatimonadaceae bacterium]